MVDNKSNFGIRGIQRVVGAFRIDEVCDDCPRLAHQESIIVHRRHFPLRIQLTKLLRLMISSCDVYDFDLERVEAFEVHSAANCESFSTSNSTPRLKSVKSTLRDGAEAINSILRLQIKLYIDCIKSIFALPG
jgi:hypothetical protein